MHKDELFKCIGVILTTCFAAYVIYYLVSLQHRKFESLTMREKNTQDQIESLRCINLSLIEQNRYLHSELKKYRKNNLELQVSKISNQKKYLDQVEYSNFISGQYENLLYACNIKSEYCPIQNKNKTEGLRRSKRTPKPPRYFSDLYQRQCISRDT